MDGLVHAKTAQAWIGILLLLLLLLMMMMMTNH
jgi:hypothetical protein